MRRWAIASFLVVLAAPARAMDAPYSWMASACLADAVVEVEVTLSTPTGKPRVDVLDVSWTRFPRARVRPQIGFGLPDRRELAQQARLRGTRAGSHYPAHVFDVVDAALARGSYRATHFVQRLPDGGWVGVQGTVEFTYLHWHDHPGHARWRAYVDPLLARRPAGAGKPAFCTTMADLDADEKQAGLEDDRLGVIRMK
jgi:hypothetical protein